MRFSRIKTHGYKQSLGLNDENLCTPRFPCVGTGILPGRPPSHHLLISWAPFATGGFDPNTSPCSLLSIFHWKPYNQLVTSFIFHVLVLVVKQIVCCEYSYLNMSKEVSWFLCLRSVDLTKVLLSLFCFSNNY